MNFISVFFRLIQPFLLAFALMPAQVFSATETDLRVLDTAGSNPTIAIDNKSGIHYVAWIHTGQQFVQVVVARSEDGKNFAKPIVVSSADTDIVSETVNPAQVAVGPKGEVYVLYQRRPASKIFEKGRGILRLVHSVDGGVTFTAAIDVLTAETMATSAGMSNLVITDDGTVIVTWLDDRNTLIRANLPEHQRPKDVRWLDEDDPSVQVRLSRSVDGGRNFSPSVLIADGASEHSQVALTIASDGMLYTAWRGKINQFKGSYDAVRDVLVASSQDGGLSWSTAVKVHNDRFKAGSCPEITIGMETDTQGRLHIAWYTGNSVAPGVYYAVSENRGISFSKPLMLLTDDWVPYADVKLAIGENEQVWIAFEDRRKEGNERVVLSQINPKNAQLQARSWVGHAPDIAAQGNSLFLILNDDKGAVRVLQAEGL